MIRNIQLAYILSMIWFSSTTGDGSININDLIFIEGANHFSYDYENKISKGNILASFELKYLTMADINYPYQTLTNGNMFEAISIIITPNTDNKGNNDPLKLSTKIGNLALVQIPENNDRETTETIMYNDITKRKSEFDHTEISIAFKIYSGLFRKLLEKDYIELELGFGFKGDKSSHTTICAFTLERLSINKNIATPKETMDTIIPENVNTGWSPNFYGFFSATPRESKIEINAFMISEIIEKEDLKVVLKNSKKTIYFPILNLVVPQHKDQEKLAFTQAIEYISEFQKLINANLDTVSSEILAPESKIESNKQQADTGGINENTMENLEKEREQKPENENESEEDTTSKKGEQENEDTKKQTEKEDFENTKNKDQQTKKSISTPTQNNNNNKDKPQRILLISIFVLSSVLVVTLVALLVIISSNRNVTRSLNATRVGSN